MTVASAAAKAGPYIGNDVATTFAFSFKVFADTDIRVVETLISTAAETDLILSGANGYTVVRNNDQDNNPGGTITYQQSGIAAALPSTKTLTIVGNFDYAQPTDLPNGGPFFAQVIENALDRLTMLVKQLKERADRTPTLPVSAGGVSGQLPAPESHNLLRWNLAETALENVAPNALVTQVVYGTTQADLFSGTGAQTVFTLTYDPGAIANLDVSVGGVTQRPNLDYTWSSGTQLMFTTAPPLGANNILVRYEQALTQVPDLTGMRVVSSMTELVSNSWSDNALEVVSFFGSWAASVAGPKGASRWHWDGTSGGVPTAATTAAIQAAMATGRVISADGKGWILTAGQKFTAYMFGCMGDRTTDDDAPFAAACVATSLLGETLVLEAGEYRLVDNQTINCAGDLNIIAEPGAVIASDKTDYNGTTTDAAFQLVITANNVTVKGPLKFETDSILPIAKYIKFKGCDSVYVDDPDMQFNDVVYATYCENCAGDFLFRYKLRGVRNSTGTVTVTYSSDPGRSANIETYLDFENAAGSYIYDANNYQTALFGFWARGYSDSVPLGRVVTNNRYQSFWAAYSGVSQGSCSGDEVDCATIWVNHSTYTEMGEAGPANADSGSTGGACMIIGGVNEVVNNAVAHGVTFFMEASDPASRGFECQHLIDNSVATHARDIGNAAFAAFSLGNHSEVEVTDSYQFNGTCTGFERGPLIRNCRLVKTQGVIDKPAKEYLSFVGCERMLVDSLGQRGGYALRDSSGTPEYGCIKLTASIYDIKPRFLVVSPEAYKSMARHAAGSFVTYSGTDACSILGVPTDSTPSVGTYERGDFIPRASISASGPFGRFCVTSGSFDTLSGVTATKNSDNSNEYTIPAGITQLYEGQYIDIAGIATTQRIQHVDYDAGFIITNYSTSTAVTGAAVTCPDPTFKNTGDIAA